jgi:tetratricopeptide (TPR) repeat protein
MDNVYDLYSRGYELLRHGDYMAAIVPLTRAREQEPGKASIREALGRALFHAQRYQDAAAEFEAIAEQAPTNDYALFCLGRSMQQLVSTVTARAAPRWRDERGCYARCTAFVPTCNRGQQYREWAARPLFLCSKPAVRSTR